MKRLAKVSLGVLLVLMLVASGIIINDLRYPPEWDQIHLRMPRSEVESLIGPDPGEMRGFGMAYWDDRGLLIRNQLQLYIDPYDGVSIISIERLSTIPKEHRLWSARNESTPHVPRMTPVAEPGSSAALTTPSLATPIQLVVSGIDVGATTDDVKRLIGEPISTQKKGENACGGTKLTYHYDGLEISFDPDTDGKTNFTVISLEVTSPKWDVAPGIRIGASSEDVLTRFGGNLAASTSGERFQTYLTKDGSAKFRFRNNKLYVVRWAENLC